VTINGGTLKLQVNKGFNEGYFQNVDNVPYNINAGATLELAGSWVTRSNSTYNINGGTISATNPGGDINYMNVINFDVAAGTISGTAGIRSGYFFDPTYTVTAAGSGSSITTSLRLFDQGAVTNAITFNVADGAQADDFTISGQVIADPSFGGLGVTKTGVGRLVLSNSTNNFNGVISLNGGILSVPHLAGGSTASALGASPGTSGNLVFDGGTLEYTGPTVTGINRAFTLNSGGGTISVTQATTDLQWTDASGAGPIIGTGSLTKTGPGTLTMAGANTYSGGTTVSQGTVVTTNNTSLGSSGVTLNDAATGASNTSLLMGAQNTLTNNITVANLGTGTTTIGSTNSTTGLNRLFSGTVTLGKDVTLQAGASDRTTFSGPITGTGNITITSPFASNRRMVFDRTSGVANDFVGDITIGDNARLQIGVANALGNRTVPDASTINFANSLSALRPAPAGSGDSETVGTLVSNAPGAGVVDMFTGTAFTLAIGADNESGVFSGVITDSAGSLSITKTGSGTQTLTGASTYVGTTTVAQGKLLVNNTTGSGTGTGAVIVQSGGVLGGNGFITTTGLTVLAGGTLAPGNSPETLTVTGPVVLTAGSIFGTELAVGGVTTPTADAGLTGTDLLRVNGTIDVTNALLTGTWGGTQANIFKGTLGPDNMMWIIDNDLTDAITGTFSNTLLSSGLTGLFGTPAYSVSLGGLPFAAFYQSQFGVTSAAGLSGGNDLLLIAIPEPGRAVLGLLALAFLAGHRRRK
jgi:autotransporter-associated beta strand protein